MRIAFLYYFDDSAWAGGRNYFSSLFGALHAVDSRVELVLLAGHKTRTTLPDDHPYLEIVRTSLLDRKQPAWWLRQAGRLLAGRRHDPLMGALLRKLRIDVLSHSQPLRGRRSDVKVLGWLPDFQFLHLPHLWSTAELERMRAGFAQTCRDSDALVVSSHDALKDLRSFMPDYTKPVHVLHFAPTTADLSRLASASDIRARYDLPQDYFFLPNQFWVHKNHRVVVDALIELKQRGIGFTVVCTGKPADPRQPDHFDALMKHAADQGVADRFKVLGVIPYADMLSLMNHSAAVINPSRFEGWSTTVEEAKAMGKRIVLSDIPVHREQNPPDALFFGTDAPTELAQALEACASGRRQEPDASILARREAANQREFGLGYLKIVESL
jgi:glycosyltransferase involved in cell wall biosynthesis